MVSCFSAKAGSRGNRHRAFSGIGRADGEGARGDFVLGLVHDAADMFEDLAEIMRCRCRRRDRVHGADFHARRHHAEAERDIAVDDDLGFALDVGLGEPEFDVEVGLGPCVPSFQQA